MHCSDIDTPFIIVAQQVTYLLRALSYADTKCMALQILTEMAPRLPDLIILDRLLPYTVHACHNE